MFFRSLLLALLCFSFFCEIPNVIEGAATFNYQEGVWISLDLPAVQRKKIDDIIVTEHTRVLKASRPSSILSFSDASDIYSILNYTNQLQELHSDVSDKIMLTLTPEQQILFSEQLEKNQAAANDSFIGLLALDLSDEQLLLVANSLISSQKKVWSIIANTNISWEERRAKLAHLNALSQVRSALIASKLSSSQLSALNKWVKSGLF